MGRGKSIIKRLPFGRSHSLAAVAAAKTGGLMEKPTGGGVKKGEGDISRETETPGSTLESKARTRKSSLLGKGVARKPSSTEMLGAYTAVVAVATIIM